jgi:hypothetical protein
MNNGLPSYDPTTVLNYFTKAVDTTYAGPVPSSLLARQDLESEVIKLTNRNTPLRDIMPRITGNGSAHLWNQRIALGQLPGNNFPSELFYKDGGLPVESDPLYVQKSAVYRYLGVTGIITGPMIASGRSFMDIEAEVAEAKMREVIQGEEWAYFHGDSTVTNTSGAVSFDGLNKQITTNTVANASAALTATGASQTGNAIVQFDKLINLVRFQGGMPTHWFCSFGMQRAINAIVSPSARYIMADGSTVTAGIHAFNYQGPAGIQPVVGDFFINPATPYPYNSVGSSGPSGATVSNIYLLQVNELEMADLMPLGRTELAKLADSIRFYLSQYTVLAVKAEPWQGVITNVLEP